MGLSILHEFVMAQQSKLPGVLEKLKKEELTLFHSYNRHAQPKVKLEVLSKLVSVITRIEVLNEVQ